MGRLEIHLIFGAAYSLNPPSSSGTCSFIQLCFSIRSMTRFVCSKHKSIWRMSTQKKVIVCGDALKSWKSMLVAMKHSESRWITVNHGESRWITLVFCREPVSYGPITPNHAQSRAITFDHAPSSCLLWRVSGRQDSVKDTRHLSLPQFKNSNATICLLFWFNTLDVNERASLKLPEKYSHLFSRRNHANNEHTDGMSSILSFWLPQHMNVSCARIFDLFCLTPTGYYQQPWPLT